MQFLTDHHLDMVHIRIELYSFFVLFFSLFTISDGCKESRRLFPSFSTPSFPKYLFMFNGNEFHSNEFEHIADSIGAIMYAVDTSQYRLWKN